MTAFTFIGAVTASGTSLTPTAHLPGDVMVMLAGHGGAATIPTLPATGAWFSVATETEATATACAMRVGVKIATATNDVSGTWTNASELICLIYRPSAGYVARVGQSKVNHSTTSTVNYPALSPMGDGGTGNSWVLGLSFASNTTQALTTAFTGMTLETSVVGASYQAAAFDTAGGVSSWSSTNQSVTGAGSTCTIVFELVLATKTDGLASNVYQHVKGGGNPPDPGGTPIPGNAFENRLPTISGAGNTVDFSFTCDAGATISSVTGSVNGAYTVAKSALGGAGNLDSYKYYFQNVTAGAAPEVITVTFGASVNAFCWEATELYGVATSGGLAGTQSAAFVTTTGTGSFIPTNNDGAGGNIILAYHSKALTGPAGITTRLFPSTIPSSVALFTLLGADIGWLNANDSMTHCAQGYLQATHAAINPTIVSVSPDSSADQWNSIAVCYAVSVGAGTAPTTTIGIQTRHHFSTLHYAGSGLYTLQAPMKGTTRAIGCNDPNIHATTVTDNEGNTWTSAGAGIGIWYQLSVTSNPNLEIYLVGGGTDTKISMRAADFINAASFDSAVASNQSVSSVTSFTMSPAPTPVAANTLTWGNVGLGTGPGKGITSPADGFFDLTTYTGEPDGDDIENADLCFHFFQAAAGAATVTLSITSVGGNSTSGGTITFVQASVVTTTLLGAAWT